MEKEDVVHVYNRISLSHKKERNCLICRDMDGPRDYHTEVSQKERNIIYEHIHVESRNMV